MARRHIQSIDSITGELLPGNLVYVPMKRHNGFGKGWCAIGQEAATLIAQNKDLGMEGYRVLWALVGQLDFNNLLVVNQAQLAKTLEMPRQNVARSIKRLITADIIIQGPRMGLLRTYRLNPHYGWKGTAQSHVIALENVVSRRKPS